MSFIDASYFVGELNIPNSGDTAVAERITWFINKYEPIFLQQLMGYPLYKAFTAGMAVVPTPDARYTDILNGKEYTDFQGYTQKWRGLKTTTQSLIANYVYYWFRRSNVTQYAGIGEVMTKAENSDNVNPRRKIASAWNEMSDWVGEFCDFMQSTQDATPLVYPEWTQVNKHDALRTFGFMNPIF